MTQEQALKELQAAFPDKADYFTLQREHSIGYEYGNIDSFYIFEHSFGSSRIIASSHRSWAHAVAIAKSADEDIWPEDHSFEEPATVGFGDKP